MRGIRLSDRVLLVSMTGGGKTTLASYIIEGLQPVRTIVVDPKDEMELGVPKARSAAELDFAPPVVHYVPASFDRDELEEAARRIWRCPGPYIVFIDEAAEISGPNYCPEGFRLLETQGRSKNKCSVVNTQRISEIHPVFRSQAEHVIVFVPSPIELDLKTLAGTVRREPPVLKDQLDSLAKECGEYSHLWFVDHGKEMRRCAPLDLGGAPRGAPGAATEDPGEPRETASALEAGEGASPPCDQSDSPSGPSSRSA